MSTPSPALQAPAAHALNQDQAAQVLRQFRVVFAEVRHHFQLVEKQVGIGGAQVWALSVIGRRPGLGMQDLAVAMDIHQSTASNLVRQLIKRDLVRSDRSTADRRAVELHLQPAGIALLASAPGPHEGVLPRALQKLPAQTLNQLQAGLGQLLGVLTASDDAAGIPLAEL